MCQFCNADNTDWKCPQCERDFMLENMLGIGMHDQLRRKATENVASAVEVLALTPIFGLANEPTYLEDFPVS